MALKAGMRLGRYEVIRAIGAGGMGEVYRAHDSRLGRDVALKVLPEEFRSDRERLRRFEQEARATAALSHPNVVAVYDVGTDSGISYVITELLDGETLRSRLKQGAVDVTRAVQIAIQIASGLTATHERGIVHRDLKPENIFLTSNSGAKILDFGLAKVATPLRGDSADDATQLTDSGIVLGTIGYMSPEQLRGIDAAERSDIFSVGAILYEMLSGRRAFKGGSNAETISAILEKDPEPLSSLSLTAPGQLLRIVARSLEKDPAKRFQSAADLRFALDSLTETAPPPKAAEKSIAVLPFANMSSTSDQEFFSDGLAEELINALAQMRGLHVASRSSSFRFRGSDLDVREIGKKLGVETVLEGSVRRAGNRLRVTVQLINTADGYHVWSERYDRELADVFAIQDEITQSVVHKLEPTLLGQTRLASSRHTGSAEAFELYLKGRHFWYQRTEYSLRAGINCFAKAIQIDPDYALAHAGVADSFSIMRIWGYVSAAEASQRARAAAQKALELDPTLAEAHFAMALYCFWFSEDWAAAEPHFKRAVELQPRSSMLLIYYAVFLATRFRFEAAFDYVDKAIELDSLSPLVYGLGALAMFNARRYEKAVELAERGLELHSDFALALYPLGLASVQINEHDRAIEACSRLAAITNRAAIPVGMLGYAYALAGRIGDANLLLDELNARGANQYVDPLGALLIYAGIGDVDKVRQALTRLIEIEGSLAAVHMLLNRSIDKFIDEPQLQPLLRRLRLPVWPGA